MSKSNIMTEIERAARHLGVETAALAAVASLESALQAEILISGTPQPLIRFEGHYFDRRLSASERETARRQGLSSATAGAIRNPPSQEARWALVNRAASINRAAAHEATSWGLGQVMGAHWSWLGYSSIDAFVAEARAGADGQLRLMTRYIIKAGLVEALRKHDWPSFARGYNGPAYRQNDYDRKLARAYRQFTSQQAPTATALLKLGARGTQVRALQSQLVERGYVLGVDGIFGPQTEACLKHFQKVAGLAVDGIAGPATLKALAATPSWLEWLKDILLRAIRI